MVESNNEITIFIYGNDERLVHTCNDTGCVCLVTGWRASIAQARAGRAEWGRGSVTGTRGRRQGKTAH